MAVMPQAIVDFLSGGRLVVAGVSRSGASPANAIFRRLRAAGHDVVPVNPNAATCEGVTCYPDVPSVPGPVHGVLIATHPALAAEVARAALACGVKHLWFHRSFGEGSVDPRALQACRDQGVAPIEGGCPLMYCPPVDLVHRLMHWWLHRSRRVPT